MITALTIIDTMKKWVEEKHPISPAQWLDACAKINILRGDLDDKLFEMESELAKEKEKLLSQDMTNAKAETIIKATDKYLEVRKLGGLLKRIEEMIKIGKKQATLKENEWNSTGKI
jgi:hypothetical protein